MSFEELAVFSGPPNDTAPKGATLDDVFGPVYASTSRIALIGAMLALSLVGNSVVCYRLLTSRRHRVFKAQALFLNLALADLLVTLVTMNSQLLWEIMGRVWIAGDGPCRVFKVLQTFALVSSTYMLVGIAVDRHYAICNPLAPAPRARSVAAGCWLLSLVPSLPNLFVFRLVVIQDKCYCASIFYIYRDSVAARQVYMAFVFTLVFVLPLVALVSLYACILHRMWKLSATHCHRPSPNDGLSMSAKCDGATSSTLPRARLRTLKMAVLIFGAFLVTNLPYMVQEMVLAFAQNVSLGPHVVAVFGVISASNSAVNPYVYLAFNHGAPAARCEACARDLLRRLTCSSNSKRSTLTFQESCSMVHTRQHRPVVQGRDCGQNCGSTERQITPDEMI